MSLPELLGNIYAAIYVLVAVLFLTLRFATVSILHFLLGKTDKNEPPPKKRIDDFGYAFRAPAAGVSVRSPCPALNTMANHGYIPRDGRNLSTSVLITALKDCFNISYPLAFGLTLGGLILLGHPVNAPFSLHDLARHDAIEHDASLVHENTPLGDEYAPIAASERLLEEFKESSRGGRYGCEELARLRVQREAVDGRGIDPLHVLIAQDEAIAIIQVFGGKEEEVSREMVLKWLKEERLPEEWKPELKSTLIGNLRLLLKLRHAMAKLREKEHID